MKQRTDFHKKMDALIEEYDGQVLPGAEAFFASEKSSDGRPVSAILFLHGFSSSPQELRGLAERFAERGYAVSLPRLTGHGTRPQHLEESRWVEWYQDAEDALHQLLADGHDQVAVVGASTGATLALQLAIQHPRSVARMVWLGPTPRVRKERTLKVLTWLARRAIHMRYKRKRPFDERNTVTDQGIFDERVAYPVTPLKPVEDVYRMNAFMRRLIPLVRTPLLVLYGAHDGVAHHTAPALLRNAPRSHVRYEELPGSRHLVAVDVDKERVYECAEEFIRSRPDDSTRPDVS